MVYNIVSGAVTIGGLVVVGLTGQQGPKGLNWRGAWTANTVYAVDDAVSNGGNTYRRKTAGVSANVFDFAQWDLVAQGGSVAAGAVTDDKLDFSLLQRLQNVSLIQALGPVPTSGGTAAPANYTFIHATTAARESKLLSLQVAVSTAGTAKIKIISVNADGTLNLYTEATVTFATTGIVTLTDGVDFSNLTVPAGGMIGLYPLTGRYTFKSGTGNSYYRYTGELTGTNLVKPGINTTEGIQFQFSMLSTPLETRMQAADTQLQAQIIALQGAQAGLVSVTQTVGPALASGTGVLAGNTYWFHSTVAAKESKLATLSVWATTVGLIAIKIIAPNADGTVSVVASADVTIATTGLVTFTDGVDFFNLTVQAGSYVGLYCSVGRVAFKGSGANKYYNSGSTTGLNITLGALQTGAELLYQFSLASLTFDQRIKNNSTSLAINQTAISSLQNDLKGDLYDTVVASVKVTGMTVDYSGTVIQRGLNGIKTTLSGTITIASASVNVAGQTLNKPLLYSQVLSLLNTAGERIRSISNLVVKRTSDQAVLVAGTDYTYNAGNGQVTGANSAVASVNVDCSYTFSRNRLDVLQVDSAGVVSLSSGVERTTEHTEDAYRAKPTGGALAIAYVFVRGATVSVLPAGGWEGKYQRYREAVLTRCIQIGRAALSKTMMKLLRGQPVTMAGYGDSITSNGGYNADFSPNAYNADRPEFYLADAWGTDALAALPKYTSVQLGRADDGAGQVHAKIGWNWQLRDYLVKKYGSVVTYNNYGLAGSNSEATSNNGLWPARINRIVADAPDLVVVGFGMNEVGSATTFANIVNIIQKLQAVGSECIVMGSARPQAGHSTAANWRYTQNALKQAALATGSAYVPFIYAADDTQLEYLGIDLAGVCTANYYNHPGLRELRLYGELLTLFF